MDGRGMQQKAFGSVVIKVRPLRLAFLVEPNNATQTRQAIQLASTLWGGAYCPIIQLFNRMPRSWRDKPLPPPSAKSVVLGNLQAFDPDVLVQIAPSVPTYVKELGLPIVGRDKFWRSSDGEMVAAPEFGIGAFEILYDLFERYFRFKARYPVKVIIPTLPREHGLFWASLFGEVPPEILEVLKDRYFEHLDITGRDFKSSDLPELIKGDVFFPRRITQHGLDRSWRGGWRGRHAYAFFMDASKTDDVIDYWNLRATGRDVFPIPKQYAASEELKSGLIRFLKEHRWPWRHNKTVCDFASVVRSRNSTTEEMEAYCKTLNIQREKDDPSDSPFFALQHWYPRMWDEWARDKDGVGPADFYGGEDSVEVSAGDSLKISIKPVWPKFADRAEFHSEPRCCNEITFRLYGSNEHLAEAFPNSTGSHFTRALSGRLSLREGWRVGRNGLVTSVTDRFSHNWEVPASQKLFFAWLKDRGWDAAPSPPGLLAREIYRNVDGHTQLLANEALLGLLEHMAGGTVRRGTLRPIENEESKIGDQRELPIGEIRNRLRGTSPRSDFTDYLISKGMFHLGLRVQCPRCLRHSWYAVETIDKVFSCPRCLNSFSAIGNVEQAEWCYKTAGPFSVPRYGDGAYATLLAVDFFDDRKLATLQASPALSFTATADAKEPLEADFALFWQDAVFGERADGLAFGESKTFGTFGEKDFKRMRHLAESFPGAVLVFATLRKALTPVEVTEIKRIARRGRRDWKPERSINPVLILTGNELLSNHGPPYCWDESIKQKFDRLRGLISVCDATQQIYLGLPSWAEEREAKWEKKRLRRVGRSNLLHEKET
jgi:hypothetical protein